MPLSKPGRLRGVHLGAAGPVRWAPEWASPPQLTQSSGGWLPSQALGVPCSRQALGSPSWSWTAGQRQAVRGLGLQWGSGPPEPVCQELDPRGRPVGPRGGTHLCWNQVPGLAGRRGLAWCGRGCWQVVASAPAWLRRPAGSVGLKPGPPRGLLSAATCRLLQARRSKHPFLSCVWPLRPDRPRIGTSWARGGVCGAFFLE